MTTVYTGTTNTNGAGSSDNLNSENATQVLETETTQTASDSVSDITAINTSAYSATIVSSEVDPDGWTHKLIS